MKQRCSKQDLLINGSISKALIWFALPLLGSSFIQLLYNAVDLIFIGNYVGKSASAAVGSGSLLLTCLVGFITGISVGAGVVVAQYYGAKDYKNLQDSVHTAMTLAGIGGIILTIAGLLLAPFILQWLRVPQEIFELSVSYIRIYFISILPMILYNMGSAVLRAYGDAKRPLIYLASGAILNVFLDWLFVVVFSWGVAGASWATTISQTLSAVLIIVHLFSTKREYRIHLKRLRIHKKQMIRIVKLGVPAGIQSSLLTVSNMVVQFYINGFGQDAMAAFTAYFKVENFMYLPILAFGQAMTSFVGQNIGAGQLKRVKKGVKIGLLLGVSCTIAVSTIVLLSRYYLFRMFNSELEVIQCGIQILMITAPVYFIYVAIEVLSGTVRVAGASFIPMVISISNLCILRIILLAIIVPLWNSVQAIAIVYPITWAATAFSLFIYYKCFRWRNTAIMVQCNQSVSLE